MLHVKPVIAIEDGEVRLIGKAIGSKKGNNLLMQLVNASGGIDFSMPYATAYSGLGDSLLQRGLSDSGALWRQNTAYVRARRARSHCGRLFRPAPKRRFGGLSAPLPLPPPSVMAASASLSRETVL